MVKVKFLHPLPLALGIKNREHNTPSLSMESAHLFSAHMSELSASLCPISVSRMLAGAVINTAHGRHQALC